MKRQRDQDFQREWLSYRPTGLGYLRKKNKMATNRGEIEGSETREHKKVENKALKVLEVRELETGVRIQDIKCGGKILFIEYVHQSTVKEQINSKLH